MAFVPDAKQRTEEGAQKHGHRARRLGAGGKERAARPGGRLREVSGDGCGQPSRSSW